MITRFKVFEFYRGPGRAIGFKHYQEEGFGFLIVIPQEALSAFEGVQKNLVTYMKRLGLNIELKTEKLPDLQPQSPFPGMIIPAIKIYGIGIEFPAVDKYEAHSIMDRIGTFFKNKKIPIIQASLITDIKNIKSLEDQMKRSIDVTKYIYRKEDIRQQLGPGSTKMIDSAYKSRRIGYNYDK